MNSRLGWLLLPALLIGLSMRVAAGEGRVLAVFGEAASTVSPPPGWSFLWNAEGVIGDSQGYRPLDYDETTMAYGVKDGSGGLRADRPGSSRYLDIFALKDDDGISRFYIASFSLQDEAEGEVWIQHGNFRNKSFPDGTLLKLFVNDELRSEIVAERNPLATLFQTNLGKLRKGDVVRVAVGPPTTASKGGGRLHFTIEEHAVGVTPRKPVPIISPPMGAAEPQRGPDGNILESYLAKHQAQSDQMIARKSELLFIGDSITSRWPQEMLEERFGKFRPVNLGAGGDWVQNVHWRILHGPLAQIQPKAIVVLIGTNNISAGFTSEEIAGGISGLVAALREKAPEAKILLHGILPRGASIHKAGNEEIRQTNAKIALLANDSSVFYFDAGDALVEPDGTISAEVMPDRLHVAGPGYTRWMGVLAPVLDQLLRKEAQTSIP